MKKMLITFFDIKGIVHSEFIHKLIMWKYRSGYVKLSVEKGLNFVPTIGFCTMTMLQLTRHCQLVSGPKVDY
jgi:hypothetical protein